MSIIVPYQPEDSGQPPSLSPEYKSTQLRSPTQALIKIPSTLTEITGPADRWPELMGGAMDDLTKHHNAMPQGQRIIVSGRVVDDTGRPVPNTMIEIWQANAAGRYIHVNDSWDAPLDPNFTGAGRAITDDQGRYKFITIRPGAYPWGNHHNAWRPAHIHLSLFGPAFATRLVTQFYFEADPLIPLDPIANAVPKHAIDRLIAKFDLATTQPSWALGYVFDIVLRGPSATPMER